MQALLMTHFLGLGLFFGGTVAALLLHRAAIESADPAPLDAVLVRVGWATDGGLLLLLLSGVSLILVEGTTLLHQAWLYVMIGAFVVGGATGGIATARTRRLGGAPSKDKRGVIGVLRSVALAAGIVAIAAGAFRWGV